MKQVRNKKKRIFSVQITNCDINCGWTVTKAEHLTFQQALDILEQEEAEKDSYWNEAAQEPSGGVASIYDEEQECSIYQIEIPSTYK